MTQTVLPETTFEFATDAASEVTWTVVRFDARERMSDLYELDLVIATEDVEPQPETLLGASARLVIHRGDQSRPTLGVIRAVEPLGATALRRFVRVEVVPALWTLSQRVDCRIFQGLNVAAIVREVLSNAGVYTGDGELAIDPELDAMPPREYCVQYQETDLDFVRRLLEEEGIPFYFRHDGDRSESLVLSGDAHVHPVAPTADDGRVSVIDEGLSTSAVEALRGFEERYTLRPTGVTVRDFDFSRPRNALSPSSAANVGAREVYEYPARASLTNYDEGSRTYRTENTTRLAKVRHEAHRTRARQGRGDGNVTGFAPGSVFELRDHTEAELERTWLLVEVEHEGEAWSELPEDVSASPRLSARIGERSERTSEHTPTERRRGSVPRYRNRFVTQRASGIDTSVPFRPERTIARPIVEGPQTARVVGPPGEEIHTDPHGRIKVQFHWDRKGQGDDRSSCWIRVAQSASGGAWGFTVLPRVGMEVMVAFLEGDPDRPIVTGCVNNGENGTSYALPEAKTKTVIKTCSSPYTGGYNEIRFEDAAGQEQLYIQAERDHDTLVKNDQTLTVRRDRTKLVVGDEQNRIERNRASQIVMNDQLTVDGDREVSVHGASGYTLAVDADHRATVGRDQTVSVARDQSLTVAGNRQKQVAADESVRVGKNRAAAVAKSDSLTVGQHLATTVAKNLSTSVGRARTVNVAKSDSLSVGGSLSVSSASASHAAVKTLTLSAGLSLTLTVGASSVTLTPDRIVIKSKNVDVFAEKQGVIESELVKINCGEKPAEAKKPEVKKEKLLDRIKTGWKNFLAKLPKPLAAVLDKVATGVVQQATEALKQGKLPKLGDLVRGAVKTAVSTAVGQVFDALKATPAGEVLTKVPGVSEALQRAQERVTSAVMRAAGVMGEAQTKLAEKPAWNKLASENPSVAGEALTRVGAPVAVSRATRRSAGVAGADAALVRATMARAASRGVRAAANEIVKLSGVSR
jgi:type VI secretion system secreted protein VgrG